MFLFLYICINSLKIQFPKGFNTCFTYKHSRTNTFIFIYKTLYVPHLVSQKYDKTFKLQNVLMFLFEKTNKRTYICVFIYLSVFITKQTNKQIFIYRLTCKSHKTHTSTAKIAQQKAQVDHTIFKLKTKKSKLKTEKYQHLYF